VVPLAIDKKRKAGEVGASSEAPASSAIDVVPLAIDKKRKAGEVGASSQAKPDKEYKETQPVCAFVLRRRFVNGSCAAAVY